MKIKYIALLFICIISGVYMGKFFINQYDDKESLILVNDDALNVYFFQQGVYSSLDSMKENTANLPFYVYSVEDDKYYVYVGITTDKNKEKLKGYFSSLGYNIYVKSETINNKAFIEVLNQYENMLSEEADNSKIKNIESQVLSKYEEIVVDYEYSN